MATPTLKAESVARAVKAFGTSKNAVEIISRVMKINEAAALTVAKKVQEAGVSAPAAPTQVQAPDSDAHHRLRVDQLAAAAAAAASKPIGQCSIQELYSLAAASGVFGDR